MRKISVTILCSFLLNSNEVQAKNDTFSLRQYCPKVIDQGTNSCSPAYAVGYNCYSILASLNIHKGAEIKTDTYSPAFLIDAASNHNNQNVCESGSTVAEMIHTLNQFGICTYSDYPVASCKRLVEIDGLVLKKASKNKNSIDSKVLFDENTVYLSNLEKVNLLKKSILAKRPVVLGVQVYGNFLNLNTTESLYRVTDSASSMGLHAVTCVGFNDASQQFELINSWGTTWGNNGFFSIGYADIARLVVSATALSTKNEKQKSNYEIAFEIYFNLKSEGGTIVPYQPSSTQNVHQIRGLGGKPFNIELSNSKGDFNFYMLNIDSKGKKRILFPESYTHSRANEAAIVVEGTTITIPEKEQEFNGLIKSDALNEPIIILVSKQKLAVEKILDEVNIGERYLSKLKLIMKKHYPKLTIKTDQTSTNSVIGYMGPLKENDVLAIVLNLSK